MHHRLMLAVIAAFATTLVNADDWPAWRGDAQRSGYRSGRLSVDLAPQWTYRAQHAPQPAWSGRDTRMPFDCAMQPVASDGRVFFGSSADDTVYALDAQTGERLWSYTADGPVRLAPALAGDRLLVASDDGYLYCLMTDDGRVAWKIRGGADASLVLGNDRLISRWPVRGGPAIADGVVYFAAGIWPSEGIHVVAADLATGREIWRNSDAGGITMPQPHGGAVAASGVSAQGSLVATGDIVLVPTGRAVPAAFRRSDGKLLYFRLQENGRYGGASVAALPGMYLNGGAFFRTADGERISSLPAVATDLAAVTPQGLVYWQSGKVHSAQLTEKQAPDRRGKTTRATALEPQESWPAAYGGTALLVCGTTAVTAGPLAAAGKQGSYGVALIDMASPAQSQAEVDGIPYGLAACDGRLYVATSAGSLYCFAPGRAGQGGSIVAGGHTKAAPADTSYERAAAEVVAVGKVEDGYCLDLSASEGRLAAALAAKTRLRIACLEPDADKAARAKDRLKQLGLYGPRVTVHQWSIGQLPPYFANLIVAPEAHEDSAASADDPQRCLRPYGGVLVSGNVGAFKRHVRDDLPGDGMWTHQYCDTGNSNCSADSLVRGPLGMLWFNDLNFNMPSRHGRGRAPLFLDGRLFIQGLDGVLAVDAYNGRRLWDFSMPGIQAGIDGDPLLGVSAMGSNYCVSRDGLYIHDRNECLRLDPASGQLLGRWAAPSNPDGSRGTWGIIARTEGALVGTLADTGHLVTYRFKPGDMSTQFTESRTIFALNPTSGRQLWRYDAGDSIRHNAVAIGSETVYLIDRPAAVGDREAEKRRGKPDPEDVHATGRLVALSLADGRKLWESADDIFGTVLVLSEAHDTLLMCYQDWRFKLASELGGRIAAFEASTGRLRWQRPSEDQTRPVINDRTVYMQPGAFDLLTGKPVDFTLARSYGCGIPSGSKGMLLFRSATLGYVDLAQGSQTQDYGGIRPGCWVNAVPAGGLVLMPDATDRCTCSYLIKASVALVPR